MFVIDASVCVKWFIEEDDSKIALSLKRTHLIEADILIAPDLLIPETTSALFKSRLFSLAEIKSCIRQLYELDMNLISLSPDLIMLAIGLASTKSVTIYDAIYLATAKELGLQFITADKKLYTQVHGDLHFVNLLSQLAVSP